MKVGEVFDDREPEAGADVFPVPAIVDLLEGAEEALLLLLADADPGVPNFERESLFFRQRLDSQAHRSSRWCEFHGLA